MTLAFEDFNSKLVEVVTVVDVDDEKQFVEVSKLKFRRDFEACWQHHNVFVLATVFFCRFGSFGLVIKLNFCCQALSTRFGQDLEVEARARF